MIVCASCGKENQDHYKFCLGCGSELPRTGNRTAAASPRSEGSRSEGTGPGGTGPGGGVAGRPRWHVPELELELPESEHPESEQPADGEPAGEADDACPECDYVNEPGNRFCAGCGYKLRSSLAPAPATRRPSDERHDVRMEGARTNEAPVTLVALNPDGAEAGRFPLRSGTTVIGRLTGGIFEGDTYLSPKHASFTTRDDTVIVRDAGSLNGVYRRLMPEQAFRLTAGQVFRIGQELIRFEQLDPDGPDEFGVEPMGAPIEGYVGRIVMVLGRESTGTAFPVPESGLNLGRERGEVLFSDDGYVSGLHCSITMDEGGHVLLTDLGSSNGTFVRLRGETILGGGDILLMGQQLFRIAM